MNASPKSAHPAAARRVLFVDDDRTFLETVKELMGVLSEGQWEIFTAESASRAFALLQHQPVDLAVIDINMGVMDGIQMLSMLNRGYPQVQKVVLTGHASEKYRAACLSNGAELYLEKPTSRSGWESLHGVLHEVVRFRPEEGFRGVLRRVGLTDVIQMECLARSSSVLEVSAARMTGQLFIETGQIVHAQCGDLTGEEAFNRLLSMSGGQFNLKPFTEPPTRSLSGQWEFLLMEAARKSDEDKEALAAATAAAPASETFQEEIERITAAAISETASPQPLELADPPGTPSLLAAWQGLPSALPPGVAARPKVDEMLVCSAQGDVLYEWQCAHTDLWVNFFEFISQRGQRLAHALPLGEFNRLEIQSGGVRAVVIIANDRGVLVKTHREALSA
jgi:CheY-like chemotaxis protein